MKLEELTMGTRVIGGVRAARFARLLWKFGIYRPEGWVEEERPWEWQAAQYAAHLETQWQPPQFEEGKEPESYWFGEETDDGLARFFPDGSVFYSDGGTHEIWGEAKSFELEYGFDFAYFTVCSINDGAEPDPTWSPRPLKNILALPTPKQRVLAALRHIKELTQ